MLTCSQHTWLKTQTWPQTPSNYCVFPMLPTVGRTLPARWYSEILVLHLTSLTLTSSVLVSRRKLKICQRSKVHNRGLLGAGTQRRVLNSALKVRKTVRRTGATRRRTLNLQVLSKQRCTIVINTCKTTMRTTFFSPNPSKQRADRKKVLLKVCWIRASTLKRF
jgi:hypothetical protein